MKKTLILLILLGLSPFSAIAMQKEEGGRPKRPAEAEVVEETTETSKRAKIEAEAVAPTPQAKTVTFISSDEQEFTIPQNVAEYSPTLKGLFEDFPDQKIPLNVPGNILALIFDILQKYAKKTPSPLFAAKNLPLETDIELIKALNYLDIKAPLDTMINVISQHLIEWFNRSKFLSLSSIDAQQKAVTFFENKLNQIKTLPPDLQNEIKNKIADRALLNLLKLITPEPQQIVQISPEHHFMLYQSNNYRYLVTVAPDNILQIINTETRAITPLVPFNEHMFVTISEDSSALIIEEPNQLRVFDLASGQPKAQRANINIGQDIDTEEHSLVISNNANFIIYFDITLQSWNLWNTTNDTVQALDLTNFNRLTFTNDGLVAVVNNDLSARLFDPNYLNQIIKQLPAVQGELPQILRTFFSPNGKYALIQAIHITENQSTQDLILYDFANQTTKPLIAKEQLQRQDMFSGIRFNLDSTLIYEGVQSWIALRPLRIWDLAGNQLRLNPEIPVEFDEIKILPKNRLLTLSLVQQKSYWYTQSHLFEVTKNFSRNAILNGSLRVPFISGKTYSPNSRFVLLAPATGNTILILDLLNFNLFESPNAQDIFAGFTPDNSAYLAVNETTNQINLIPLRASEQDLIKKLSLEQLLLLVYLSQGFSPLLLQDYFTKIYESLTGDLAVFKEAINKMVFPATKIPEIGQKNP